MAKTETLNLEVKSNIKSVTKDTDDLNKSLEKSVDETKDLGDNLKDAGDKGAGGFNKMGTAIKGMGTALKAAGIGLVVALIAKLMDVFRQNQKVMDFFNTAMESLSIAFNDLFDFLNNNVGKMTGWFKELFEDPQQNIIDFGDAIEENLIERFNSFAESLGLVAETLRLILKGQLAEAGEALNRASKEMVDVLTGVNNSYEKGKEIIKETTQAVVDYTKSTVASAKATIELSNAAKLAIAVNQGLIEKNDVLAEKQRQIRDDESKTFAERLAANRKLGKILDDQKIAMEKNADLVIAAARNQLAKDKANIDNQVLLQEAINEKAAIEAQITGQKSEQMINAIALEKELLETQKELQLATLEGIDLELQELENAYEQKLEMARKAGKDTLAIDQKYYDDVVDIVMNAAQTEMDIKKDASDKEIARDKAVNDAKVGMAQNALGAMAALAGDNVEAGKAIAVAQTIFSTQQAIMSALSGGGTDIALPYWVKLGNAISAGIMGAKSIQTILSTSPDNLSGATATVDGSATPAPQMMSGAFELGSLPEEQPVQAYVVSDDITDSQNGLAVIRRRATI